ncbi:MAG: ABC transporter permease [Janthinobacterium lividum]
MSGGLGRLRRSERLVSLLLMVVVVGGWEALVRLLHVPRIVLPAPSEVAVALWRGIRSGLYPRQLLVTLVEILGGFTLGATGGLMLGILVGLSRFVERVFYPYIVAFQTLPKVAIAPIIVIWFGYGLSSKIIITAAIAFFPVLANTIVGLRAAPRDQLEMLKSCTATPWQSFHMVRLPHAMPFIFVGLDVAIVLSVIGAIVGEFVGAKAGLGYLILQMNFSFDMASVFAILLILSAIGVVLHLLVAVLHRRIVFWAHDLDTPPSGA